MTREAHIGLRLKLERLLGVKVMVRSQVNAPNRLIVVLDVPEITPKLERLVKTNTPTYLEPTLWAYAAVRDAARDPNSPLEHLLVAAHILPQSVATNPVLDWIALENPVLAAQLRELL